MPNSNTVCIGRYAKLAKTFKAATAYLKFTAYAFSTSLSIEPANDQGRQAVSCDQKSQSATEGHSKFANRRRGQFDK